jgi:hypothetical protein
MDEAKTDRVVAPVKKEKMKGDLVFDRQCVMLMSSGFVSQTKEHRVP